MRRSSITAICVAALCLACGKPTPSTVAAEPSKEPLPTPVDSKDAPRIDDAFWKIWGDGNAELAGYELIQPKYGAPRQGTAVTIFVSETFSNEARVKADAGRHPDSDLFPVMKLNLVKDFQTGIYDYNEMLSAFVAMAPVNGRPAGSLTKSSFSSQEWCGQVWSQALFDPAGVRTVSHSYFDGEADKERKLDYPADGISEDVLPLWARGMARPVLAPGESRTVPILTGLETSRDKHTPLTWGRVVLSRSAESKPVKVAAGTFDVETFTAALESGVTRTFLVQNVEPRRIVQWETSAGEKASLLAADRMKYWTMNRPGGEDNLKRLGLKPRPARTM